MQLRWHRRRVLACAVSVLLLLQFAAPGALAQEAKEAPEVPEDEKTEVQLLREEIEKLEQRMDQETHERRRVMTRNARDIRVYGDIGLRWQGVFTNGKVANTLPGGNEFNRPEYRIRLGVAGYLKDTEKHRFKFDVRLAVVGQGEFDAPLGAPTIGWHPFDAFGSAAPVTFDRIHGMHTYKNYLRLGLGKFGSILEGTEMIFDRDFGLMGGYFNFDIGKAAKFYEPRPIEDLRYVTHDASIISRIQLRAAGYYLAQNNIGFPTTVATTVPHGASLQLLVKMRYAQSETSLLLAPGFHYFEGEEAIGANIGTGYTSTTTSTVDSAGLASSQYRIGDLFGELTFFERHTTALRFFAHYANNFGAITPLVSDEKQRHGLVAGVEWGMLRLQDFGDFRIGYRYIYVEADAAIPELNSDAYSTNYVGHAVNLQYNVLPSVTLSVNLYLAGKRENEYINGVGRDATGEPGTPSNDREQRYRMGVMVRF